MNHKNNNINTDACIHCHICRQHCVFLEKYGIDIGDVGKLEKLAYHCFLCGKCSQVCPKGIDGREIILDMRRTAVQKYGKCREQGYRMLLAEKKDYLFRNSRHLSGKSILFPGCNFPSFYPNTTKKMIRLLNQAAGMGVLFDCCGKPVAELGFEDTKEQIAGRINQMLSSEGVEEVVMVCPNCYDFLKGQLKVRVVSIYEKLLELGLGEKLGGKVSLFLPCPDREEKQWVSFIIPFLAEKPDVIEGTQCCGLGGGAAIKERELARSMSGQVMAQGYDQIYTYCASCAGNFTRNGRNGVDHILTEILGCKERPDTRKSLLNRMMTKFW